jgi:quaternary ammonium compound-resistance protein SugE
MNAWVALVLAGAFEVGFTSSMKMAGSPSASRWWTALFWVSVISSFALLSEAIKTIPLGTAYAVWTGIGAVGTAVVGIAFFKDPGTFWRLFFLTVLIGSIAGLKFVSPK